MSEAAKPVDMRANVKPDGSEASISVPADFPRDCVTLSYCRQKMMELGVQITPQVTAALEELVAAVPPEGEAITRVVARKVAPVHGIDGVVDWHVESEAEFAASVEPATAESATGESGTASRAPVETTGVNHYETSAYIMVTRDQVIGRVIDPVDGIDGRDVTGRSLAAKVGRPAKVTLDDSIMLTADGSLIAQTDGIFHRTGNKAKICQMLEVTGYVDFSTGNIDFMGDLLIHKGVRDCFIVKASNNIEARGLIEAATIEAGGDLKAGGGMAGRERGTVRVGRDLLGRYLDNIKGNVGRDMMVEREVINCTLDIGGAIRMPNANIIGGRITVTGSADIGEIGSAAGTLTHMIFGFVPALDAKLNQLDDLLEKFRRKHEAIIQEQHTLNAGARFHTPQQKERACEISFELHQYESGMHKTQTARDILAREIARRRMVSLTVNRMLHRGVVIIINDQQFRIDTSTRGPLHVGLDATGRAVIKRGNTIEPLALIATASMSQLKVA